MKKYVLASLIIFIASLIACTKEKEQIEQDPTLGLIKITEGYANGASAKVVVYCNNANISTGYTRFYLALFDSISGNRIEDAEINLTPKMDMGTMTHSAPYENPSSTRAERHLFPCSVTFVMPSASGNWTLKLDIKNIGAGKTGSFVFPVTVSDPVLSRQKSFTANHNGAKYFISLIEPTKPKVGINDFEIAIYKKVSMMSWPADSSLSVMITPEMPTMGHGSPNNVNPIHIQNGHYKGKVNFTMTGLWRLNLDYMSGTAVADTTQYFDIEF